MGTYAPATATLIGFTLFLMAFGALVLRVGPKRGTWNQPAALLVRPGSKLVIAMWVLALVHVALGVVAAAKVPAAGAGIVVVATVMGAIYVLMAYSYQLAMSVAPRLGLAATARTSVEEVPSEAPALDD